MTRVYPFCRFILISSIFSCGSGAVWPVLLALDGARARASSRWSEIEPTQGQGLQRGGEGGEALEGLVAGLEVVSEVVGVGGALEAADEEKKVPAVEVVAVGIGGEAGEEVGGSLGVAGI
jgi:hypothetical protein